MIFIAIAVTTTVSALYAWPFQEVKQTVEASYPIAAHGTLRVDTPNGDISVQTWSGDTVNVIAHKQAASEADLARQGIDANAVNGDVAVKTIYPPTCTNCEISLDIRVPRGVSVVANSLNGTLRAFGIKGTLSLHGANGDIAVFHAGASLVAQTSNGNISVDGAAGSITCETASGSISIADVAGDIAARSASGNVSARFAGLGTVRAIALATASGDVMLAMPRRTEATINAATVSGSIASDFGLTPQQGYAGATLVQTIGTGRVRVQLRTISGEVSLRAI